MIKSLSVLCGNSYENNLHPQSCFYSTQIQDKHTFSLNIRGILGNDLA